ncbi:MAG: AbrB/MazE/SpoVT family DNA-binding domain-containing protein [Candidatus Lokiarchaeota archaeon]|nr:AbrB/MazE/SpoVT family DNA-binding domain-containing protein [Candidatus Lokiarchaeota archaeon]
MIIKRKVGPKGQVVIPKDVRELMGIAPGDEVLIEVDDTGVRIRPGSKHDGNDDFLERFFTIPRKLKRKIDIEKQIDEEYP